MSPMLARCLRPVVFLLIVALCVPMAANAARDQLCVTSTGSNGYLEDVIRPTQGEGDVWGGEQGIIPEGGEEPLPTTVTNSRLNRGQASWLVRLASLFASLNASKWFSNLE